MSVAESLSFGFPNDGITWTIMIVLYPYITGLVAGSFIISALYHVFGVEQLKPVAKFSLVACFAFLCFATTPLLLHLGHPENAFNVMLTPNPTSAMAGFGFIYSFYFVLVAVELWLTFRPTLVERAEKPGLPGMIYRVLCLGVYSIPEGARKLDARVMLILAGIGIPSACVLHGYVGFIFGAIKANPWWSSSLMPIIFLLSAMVSGIALLVIMYWISCKIRRVPIDHQCMRSMLMYLWGFLIIDVCFETLELLMLAYESTEHWHILREMLLRRIGYSYFGVQFLVCSGVPLLALGWVLLSKRTGRVLEFVGYVSSFLLLLQVLAMRWNVVVGGQSFSKSWRALQDYSPPFLGREGLLAGFAVLAAPFILLTFLCWLLPVWDSVHKRSLPHP